MRILFQAQLARWAAIPWIVLVLIVLATRAALEDDDTAAVLCLAFAYLLIRALNLGVVVIPQRQTLKIRGYLITRSHSLIDKSGRPIEAYEDDYAGPLFLYGEKWGSVSFRDSTGRRIAKAAALGSGVETAARNRREINQAITFALSIQAPVGPQRAKYE